MIGRARLSGQMGFSMVEMLMTALILAIGLLGLAMLQALSMRTTRGGKSLATAVQLAERVMDQIELEGRLTWLNVADSSYATPASLSQLQFVGKGTVYQGFDASGAATTAAPVAAAPSAYYVAKVTETAVSTGTTGLVSDYTVALAFVDQASSGGSAVTRNVTLTRRVVHG